MNVLKIEKLYKLLDEYLNDLYVTNGYKCTTKTKNIEKLLKDFECIRVVNGEQYSDYR